MIFLFGHGVIVHRGWQGVKVAKRPIFCREATQMQGVGEPSGRQVISRRCDGLKGSAISKAQSISAKSASFLGNLPVVCGHMCSGVTFPLLSTRRRQRPDARSSHVKHHPVPTGVLSDRCLDAT